MQARLFCLVLFIYSCILLPAQTFLKLDRDLQQTITLAVFDSLVDNSVKLLETKPLAEIGDTGHVGIMMSLNTIMMAHDTSFAVIFKGGRYEKLLLLYEQKNYARDITKIYPEFGLNRGMGYFFPKLRMELYGTPMPYAWFHVVR